MFGAELLEAVDKLHATPGLGFLVYLVNVGAGGGLGDEQFLGSVLHGAALQQVL